MFFISPIKTLYSIKFYLQTLKEPLWKAFCFVAYLFVLGAIFLTIYTPIKLNQPLNQGVEFIANYIPNIKISNGVITANNNTKITISPQELQGYKIIFDTASTEPAYPTQMQKENILMYVNQNTVYVLANGQFQQNVIQKNFEFEISKKTLLENKEQIVKSLSHFLVFLFILILAIYLVMFSIMALIVALIMNAVIKIGLKLKELLTLSLYLQGPVFILNLILLILPTRIIDMNSLVAIVIFVIYLNLIFLNLRAMIMPKTEVPLNEGKE